MPDEPLYVVAIAAISNVASALLAAPDIVERVVVIWLGGHALEWPNQAEFNLRQDVGGAQVLFDSGVPLVLVPCMGVVSHFHSTIPEIDRYVRPHGRIGEFLAARFAELATERGLSPVGWSKVIWDMVAVGWLLNADWAHQCAGAIADPDRSDHVQRRPYPALGALRYAGAAGSDLSRLHRKTVRSRRQYR